MPARPPVDCAAEGLKVEVIPMLTMAMGSATKTAMTKDGLDPIMQFDRPYRVEAAGKNGFYYAVDHRVLSEQGR